MPSINFHPRRPVGYQARSTTEPIPPVAVPAAVPRPRFPDPAVTVPESEPLVTTFGVELEIRPRRRSEQNHAEPGAVGTWWREFLTYILDSGFINPARAEVFRSSVINNPDPCGGLREPLYRDLVNCNASPYWSRFCHHLHPDILAGLTGMYDGADAGGDELKTPILTSADQTRRFFQCLYTVLPHIYDLRDIDGCGMHIHVGRGESAHTVRFERFMLSREWVFQTMVPAYRRHGYNRVWRTDTLLALVARRAASEHRNLSFSSPLSNLGEAHRTFDGDLQDFFAAGVRTELLNPYGSPTIQGVPAHLLPITLSGIDSNVFRCPLFSTHGHWVCGGRDGRTTEFRLFAPPPCAEDVVNWIRLLNLIWKFTRDESVASVRRSAITPALSAATCISLLQLELNNTIPSDLLAWMNRQTQFNGAV